MVKVPHESIYPSMHALQLVTACQQPLLAVSVSPVYTYPGTTSGTECHDSAAGAAADLPLGNSAYTIYAEVNNPGTGAEGIVAWGSYGTTRAVNAFRMGGENVLINYWCVIGDSADSLHALLCVARGVYFGGFVVFVATQVE